jgi:hypothetical protein
VCLDVLEDVGDAKLLLSFSMHVVGITNLRILLDENEDI